MRGDQFQVMLADWNKNSEYFHRNQGNHNLCGTRLPDLFKGGGVGVRDETAVGPCVGSPALWCRRSYTVPCLYVASLGQSWIKSSLSSSPLQTFDDSPPILRIPDKPEQCFSSLGPGRPISINWELAGHANPQAFSPTSCLRNSGVGP